MIREHIIDDKVLDRDIQKSTSLNLAKVLMTLAIYFICAASLLEYFSTIFTLKTLGFMLSAHSFYFLLKFQKSL